MYSVSMVNSHSPGFSVATAMVGATTGSRPTPLVLQGDEVPSCWSRTVGAGGGVAPWGAPPPPDCTWCLVVDACWEFVVSFLAVVVVSRAVVS